MRFDPAWLFEGLTDAQIKGVVKVSWRLVLITHIAWVCGWLSVIGIASPFARADEVASIQRKTNVLLRAAIDSSLRGLVRARCQVTGERELEVVNNEIDIQKDEWQTLTGREWKEPSAPCKVEGRG